MSADAWVTVALALGAVNSWMCWSNVRAQRKLLALMRQHFRLSTIDWMSRMTSQQRSQVEATVKELLGKSTSEALKDMEL